MPRCMPGLNCAPVRNTALALWASAILLPQIAWSEERELRWISPSSISTLDAYVAPQSSEIDATLRDHLDRGISSAASATSKTKSSQRASSKPKSTWKRVTSSASPSTAKSRSISKRSARAAEAPSPFGKWLAPEDIAVRVEQRRPAKTAVATDSLSIEVVEEVAVTKVSRRKAPAKKASQPATNSSSEPPERLAFRFRRREAQQPQKPWVPEATMHPTERQKDDRRQPKEPPVENIPKPKREESELTPVKVVDDLPPLSRGQQRLRTKVRRVLAHYYNRPLNTGNRSPWEVMHSLLAFEVNSKVLKGGPRGEPITAVGWLCFNQPCKRRTLMYVNDAGELRVRVGPALQGHRGQLLAMLAQSKVSRDYPMRVEGHDLSVADLIEMEKSTCFPRSELTFKLIGLMHYLPSDSEWVNEQGMEWNLRKLVKEELRQPIRGAACGGTHRLSGLTLAYKTRERRGEPVDGEYLRAKQFVAKYKNYAYRLQNSDGSLSTEWFRGPGDEESVDRRLKTTGHLLEWLLYAASEKELKYSRLTRAANYLANIMYNNRNKNWEAGPLGHAIHALLLYDRLVFSPYDELDEGPLASKPKRSKSSSSSRSRR